MVAESDIETVAVLCCLRISRVKRHARPHYQSDFSSTSGALDLHSTVKYSRDQAISHPSLSSHGVI
jgi:hypothetical protein